MDSIFLALNVVFPIFFMLMVGYVIQRLHWVDEYSLNIMNKVDFRIFIAILVFLNIYGMDLREVINKNTAKLIILMWFCVFFAIISSKLILGRIVDSEKKVAVMTQGIYRSNLVLFGIPVASTLYGEEGVAVAAILIGTVVPLFNLMAVILLEKARAGKANIKKTMLGIIKNPLIIASVLGLLFSGFRIQIPDLLLSPLTSMSQVATPLAFVILGASLHFSSLRRNLKYLLTVSVGKLILVPALAFTIAYFMGFRDAALAAILGAMASPTAVSSFSMAKELDVEGELAGQIVAFDSVLSIVTIFFWVIGLRNLGML